MALAVVCAVLTWVGFFLTPPHAVWAAVANRLLAVTVIGFTVMLSVLRKRAEDDLQVLHGLLPICSYCKKIREGDSTWVQIEQYINERTDASFSHGICPECYETRVKAEIAQWERDRGLSDEMRRWKRERGV